MHILPMRPVYDTTAVVEYHATIASTGHHVIRCERVDADTAHHLNLPVTHLPDARQFWVVSLIDPSGHATYLTGVPCDWTCPAATPARS
jgi:hypothetical protein